MEKLKKLLELCLDYLNSLEKEFEAYIKRCYFHSNKVVLHVLGYNHNSLILSNNIQSRVKKRTPPSTRRLVYAKETI